MKTLHWYTTGKNRYQVQYTYEMVGGGTTFGTEFADVLSERYPNRKFERLHEWCSGPAFIGFDLLDRGIANTLHATDLYFHAIQCVRNSAKVNNLSDRVSTTLLEDISLLPATEKFDLVIGNPPHTSQVLSGDRERNRILMDYEWNSHRNFFTNIASHLTPDAVILLLHNLNYSRVETFEQMIDDAGLEVNEWFMSKNFYNGPMGLCAYYIEIVPKKNKGN